MWNELSVIVPVGPGDPSWTHLVEDLALLPVATEVVFVSPEFPRDAPARISASLCAGRRVRWLKSEPGRARQLNLGAREASGRFLWFLHADSRFADGTITALAESVRQAPEALHFFNLEFATDGPAWTKLNQSGTWFRSRLLKVPFGDQGFCLAREVFTELGGFDETAPYGEDHLLVWSAHRAGVPLRCTGARLSTSARKYRERGWLRTTLGHLGATAKQALPQATALVREKYQGGRTPVE